MRELADEKVRVRHFGRRDHLFVGGIQPAKADVLHDRVGEQVGILQDQAELAAKVILADIADIPAIDGDTAAVDLVETRQQVDDGGLAGPGRAHQGEDLPGFGLQRHILEDRDARPVFEIDILEAYPAMHRIQRGRLRPVIHLGRRVDHLEDPFRPGQGSLDGVIQVG